MKTLYGDLLQICESKFKELMEFSRQLEPNVIPHIGGKILPKDGLVEIIENDEYLQEKFGIETGAGFYQILGKTQNDNYILLFVA